MRKAVLFIGLAVSLVLAACGGKQPDPVDLITSAAEESSAVETTAEETAAEAESIVAEMPSIEGETVAVYEYEVFDDAEPHLITYWTDGETRKTQTFRNLIIPEWGVEKIALPAFMFSDDAHVYHLNPGEEIKAENFSGDYIYDDSVNYNGAYSIRHNGAEFRTWRAKFDIEKPEASTPGELFIAAYPFSDIEYGGKILIRPRNGVAHCVLFADSRLEEVNEEMEYVFYNSIKLTAVDAITGGEICARD